MHTSIIHPLHMSVITLGLKKDEEKTSFWKLTVAIITVLLALSKYMSGRMNPTLGCCQFWETQQPCHLEDRDPTRSPWSPQLTMLQVYWTATWTNSKTPKLEMSSNCVKLYTTVFFKKLTRLSLDYGVQTPRYRHEAHSLLCWKCT